MNCKDCLHYEACEDIYYYLSDDDNPVFDEQKYAMVGCAYFSNRSEWVHLPCERVYFICDKNTKFATVMSKSIKDLSIHEIEEINKSGYYFSTKEKAEKALEE